MKNLIYVGMSVLSSLIMVGQVPCLEFEASDLEGNTSVLIDCEYPLDTEQCLNLTATYTPTFTSNTYSVESIPFDDAIPVTSGNVVNAQTPDDTWGQAIDLPFPFCFFGNTFHQIVIADNGLVSFNTAYENTNCVFTAATLPNTSLYKNTIYALYHDLTNDDNTIGCNDNPNTSENECGDIRIQTLGEYPCRKFVVNYNHINHFGCSNVNSSFQLILYEGTQIIDLNIWNKPENCESPNPLSDYRKKATIGIQNADGTLAYFAAGYNAEVFDITQQSFRFSPNGPSNSTLTWTDPSGNILGHSEDLAICDFTNGNYTATIRYDQCQANPIEFSQDISVEISEDYPYAHPIEISVCDELLDGQETLDLTTFLEEINDHYSNFNIAFYETYDEAQNALNAITLPEAYTATDQSTIYARVEFGTQCFDIAEVYFNFNSPIVITPQNFVVCDLENDNIENISLSDYTASMVENAQQYNIGYYLSFSDAENEVNPQTEIQLTTDLNLWIRVDEGDCINIQEFSLQLEPVPTFSDITLQLCENTVYDLSQHAEEISNGQSNVTLTYHRYLSQAENGTNALNPNRLINWNTYYVRIQNNETGCYSVARITVEFLDSPLVENAQLVQCVNSEEDEAIFNLHEGIALMVNNPNAYTYTIYSSLSAAQNQNNAFQIVEPDLTQYTGVYPHTTVYVRFEENATGCVAIGQLTLYKALLPEPIQTELYACNSESNTDEFVFDLHNLDASIIGNTSDNPNAEVYFVEYYETLENAQNQTSQINEYIVTGTHTLYIRIVVGLPVYDENGNPLMDDSGFPVYEESCFGIFEITLQLVEISDIVEAPIVFCDHFNDGTERLDLTQYTTAYTSIETFTDFRYIRMNGSTISQPTQYQYISSHAYFYLQYYDENGCRIRVQYPLEELAAPELENRTVEICDFGDDQMETLDLQLYTSEVITPIEQYNFAFFTNLQDAKTNNAQGLVNSPNAYMVNATNNTVYVRVEDDTEHCVNVMQLQFVFQEAPEIQPLIFICDYDGNTFLNDYTLSNFNTQLLFDDSQFSFEYYDSYANADSQLNAYTQANIYDGQTWYIRLESNLGCVFILTSQISFFSVPELASQLAICNDNNGTDELITLSELNEVIVNNSSAYTFNYYLTENDFNQQTNPLSDSETLTVEENTQLYVQVDFNHACSESTPLTIQFLPTVEVFNTQIISCDLDNNLEESFDLSSALSQLCPLYTEYQIGYYTQEEAANNANADFEITSNISQYSTNQEDTYIYVRFENPNTGCYSVAELNLHISPIPKLVNSTFEICDLDFNGTYDVELPLLNDLILDNGNMGSDFTYQYYTSHQDALMDANAIEGLLYSSSEGTFSIFVKVINSLGCYSIAEVQISEIEQAEAQTIEEIVEICDLLNDGIETLDITQFESEINPQAESYTYYSSFEDMVQQTHAIANPLQYETHQATTEIYVRITQSGYCDNYSQFSIQLLESPESTHMDEIYFCIGETATLSVEDGYLSYFWHETQENTSSIEVTEEGSYTVTITDENGCTTDYTLQAINYINPDITIEYTDNHSIQIQYDTTLEDLTFSLDGVQFQAYPYFDSLPTGVHTLYIFNENSGCYYTQSFYIVGTTNTITPNGDGINDVWKLENLDYFGEEFSHFRIYDRYGKMMHENRTNETIEWDGHYKGRPVPTGAYWYLLELPDGRTYKGWIFVKNPH